MGVPVEDFQAFKTHYEESGKEVFAFLLHLEDVAEYDLAKFLVERGNFIDQIAKRSNIWTYYFYRASTNAGVPINPVGILSNIFGVKLCALPALLVFAKADHLKECPSVAFHLDPFLFKPERRPELERRFKDLYDKISACQESYEDPYDVIRCLSAKRRAWDYEDAIRPGSNYVKRQIEKSGIEDLPSDLMATVQRMLRDGILNTWRGGGTNPSDPGDP